MASPAITSGASGARWAPVVLGASVATGVLVAAAPIAGAAIAGAIAAAVAFASWPLTLLLLALLARPSLDATDELFTIAGVNLSGMLGVALVVGGGVALLAGPRGLPGRSVLHFGVAMLVIGATTLLWSLDPDEGFRILVGYATPIVVFGLAVWAVRTTEHLHRLVGVALVSAIVPIGMGLFQLATGDFSPKQGFLAIQGPFVHANGFGFFLLVTILLAIVAFMESRTVGLRLVLGIGIGLAVVCLLNTYARSAWIALAVALLFLVVVEYRRLAAGLGIAAIMVLLAFPLAISTVNDRFADLSPASANYGNNSFSWRTENWTRMSDYAFDQPLTGHGLGSYLPLSENEFGPGDYEFLKGGKERRPVYAHNDYLNLGVEIGIPGLLLYIATFIALMAATWRARRVVAVRAYATLVTATALGLLIVSAVDNVKDYNAVMYVLFAVGGAVVGVAARESRKTPAA